jgi:NitT/TauT family transport system substrate-binding protein
MAQNSMTSGKAQQMVKKQIFIILMIVTFIGTSVQDSQGLTTVKVGLLKLSSSAPIFIGMEKGFFEAEGIRVEPVWFKSAQPIALATASGDIDIGATGLTAGLYNSVSQGIKIAIVADKGREWPGYRLTALMVDREQWQSGLKELKDLRGKRVGITQMGSTFHYILGNLLEKQNIGLNEVKIVPLGSLSAMRDTLLSHQIESAFVVQPHVAPLEKARSAKVLLWAGDHLPYQIAAIFYGEKFQKNRAPALSFMKGYIRSCRYYYDQALAKKNGPKYREILSLIAKYTEETTESVALALSYIDRNGELYSADIQKQLDWYLKHNLLSKGLSASEITDLSFWKEALKALEK